jgi:hypothetical protein
LMQALRILLHALRQVFGNFRQALLLSVLPLLIAVSIVAVVIMKGQYWAKPSGAGFWISLAAMALTYAFTFVWLAVRWHRFILLNDHKNLLVPPPGPAMGHYVGVALLTAIILAPAVLVMTGIMYAVFQGGGGALTVLVGLVLSYLFCALMLILATALPGAAIGAARPIQRAWHGLEPAAGSVLVLTLIGIVSYEIIEALTAALLGVEPLKIVAPILFGVIQWLTTLVGLSVLTTLWGHYVEGRPLR